MLTLFIFFSGVFNVSSLHAFICARSPAVLNHLIASKCGSRRRGASVESRRSSVAGSRPSSAAGYGPGSQLGEVYVSVQLSPEEQPQRVRVKSNETVEDLLWRLLADRPLQAADFFIRAKRQTGEQHVPARGELLQQLAEFDLLEICAKSFYQVELCRTSLQQLFGFSVEAELVEAMAMSEQPSAASPDELCVFVSRVEENSLAAQQQLGKGDEIMLINGAMVAELDMMYIESVLQEELSLCMMLRTSRPSIAGATLFTPFDLAGDEYIESLVCPPPPPDVHISDEMIGRLIAPPPAGKVSPDRRVECLLQPEGSLDTQLTSTSDCLDLPTMAANAAAAGVAAATAAIGLIGCTPTPPPPPPPDEGMPVNTSVHFTQEALPPPPGGIGESEEDSLCQQGGTLSDTEKLKKVIVELVETEKAYVEVYFLNNFFLFDHILK